MKSAQIIFPAIAFATIGWSLPTLADTAAINDSVQSVVITGNNNSVNQNNHTSIRNNGVRNSDNTGAAVRTRQAVDILGDNNTVNQNNFTQLRQSKYRNR